MRTRIAAAAFALAVAAPFAALACEGHQAGAQEAAVKEVSIDQLAKLSEEKKATVVDANNADTRAKHGVIPGAVLLSHYAEYEPAKELPSGKDSKLVFYCGGPRCTAAEKAAKRALSAGYQDVNVFRGGIKGWKEAGKPTSTPRS